MSRTPQIRPKCRISSDLPPDRLLKEIKLKLSKSKDVTGRILNNNVYLRLPEEELHYWSPEFQVIINKKDNGSLVKGIAGPNPKVWATFMVFYGLAAMLLIFGGSFGISQWMLDIDSIWIWSLPVSILLYIIIYGAANYGQGLGADQLISLRSFLDEAIESAESGIE